MRRDRFLQKNYGQLLRATIGSNAVLRRLKSMWWWNILFSPPFGLGIPAKIVLLIVTYSLYLLNAKPMIAAWLQGILSVVFMCNLWSLVPALQKLAFSPTH